MPQNIPFTEEEKAVMDLLVQAHGNFINLPAHHPSDIPEWVHHLHALQNILMARIAARDYPEYFTQP